MHKLLISKIKEKKPLDNLDDEIILEQIQKILNQNLKIKKSLDENNPKNSSFKKLVSLARNELNKRYGIFWLDKTGLTAHKSSKERFPYYKQLYKKIFEITGNPKTILDIACGLNPLSIPLMEMKPYYTGIELSKIDCENLNNWLKINKINGKIIQQDITKSLNFPSADLVFLFKVFDSVEEKGHKLAEKILKNLNCRYAVISFSTTTLKGNKMNFPRRGWIEQLLKRLNYKYKNIELPNEIFYVVRL